MSKIKVLELFAGSRSIGKTCEELGYQVFSSDINAFEKIDYIVSILDFDIKQLPFVPDIVWASPPCTTYSVLAISHHRNGIWPKTENAVLGDRITEKTNSIIKELQKLNPDLAYYIENPRGMMRKMPFMQEHPIRRTVTYCQYGFNYMKPTDIWTNNILWKPRKACKNGDPCHESTARNNNGFSINGLVSLKNNYERSKLPPELCKEILTAPIQIIRPQLKLLNVPRIKTYIKSN